MKKLVYMFLLMVVLTSCASEDLLQSPEVVTENGTKIQPEEAVQSALAYMHQIFPETRGADRSDYVITPVRRVSTRAPQNGEEYPDTLYYVINFGEDEGFALMGADRRLPDLLAISDMDNMNLEDTVFNRGLADFMSDISLPYLPVNPPRDSLMTTIVMVGEPMLTVDVRKWSQGAPYNNECPIFLEGKAPTGCVPLAVGQIFTFYEWPMSYGLVKFDWKKMKNGKDNDTVAELLRILGTKKNLAAEYTATATGVENENLPRTFNNFDYDFTSGAKPLNKEFPYGILNKKFNQNAHPILVYGEGSQIIIGGKPDDIAPNSKHVWVADGCMTKITKENDGSESEEFYIHCVWGWGGANNGYFLYTYNGVIGGKPDELAPGDQKYDFEGYVYNKTLSGWIDFKKKEE